MTWFPHSAPLQYDNICWQTWSILLLCSYLPVFNPYMQCWPSVKMTYSIYLLNEFAGSLRNTDTDFSVQCPPFAVTPGKVWCLIGISTTSVGAITEYIFCFAWNYAFRNELLYNLTPHGINYIVYPTRMLQTKICLTGLDRQLEWTKWLVRGCEYLVAPILLLFKSINVVELPFESDHIFCKSCLVQWNATQRVFLFTESILVLILLHEFNHLLWFMIENLKLTQRVVMTSINW